MAREKNWRVDGDSQIHLTIEHKRGVKKPKYSFAVVAKSILISASLIASLAINMATSAPVYASDVPAPTAITATAQTQDQGTSRLAGQTRYDTAVSIARQGWTTADYAILAYGENYPDALASAPLSVKYDAPILLTESGNLTDVTKQVLRDLKVKNVLIVGGTGVISPAVENQVKSIVPNVERIAGETRYDTSVAIANKLGNVDTVFVATGDSYADALSAGSIAGKVGAPVLLVQHGNVPDSVRNYLNTHNIQKTYIIGGTGVVGDGVANQLPNVQRLAGETRYGTNTVVLKNFESTLSKDTICVATGEGFADALTGAAYAAKIGAPIVLLPKGEDSATRSYMNGKLPSLAKTLVFGGTGVIPDRNLYHYLSSSPTPTPTIRDELQLVDRLNTAANFVKTLYNSNTLSASSLNQLADRLVEIENRLNAGDLTYGQNLINAIKTTDTSISGIDPNKTGLTKSGDVNSSYTNTVGILTRVKGKVGLPNNTPTPTPTPAPIGGTTVYVSPITEYGQTVSTSPGAGREAIVVRHGKHTYGSNNQSEYDTVMEHVERAKAIAEREAKNARPWEAIMNYKNGKATSSDMNYVRALRGLDVDKTSIEQLQLLLTVKFAQGAVLDKYDTTSGESAYSALVLHKGDCNALAYKDQAIWDAYNFNTRIQYNENHAWCEIQFNGKWFNVDGGFSNGKPSLGTLISPTW